MPESQELLREAFARHLIVTEKSLGEIFPDIQKGAEMLLEVIKINKKKWYAEMVAQPRTPPTLRVVSGWESITTIDARFRQSPWPTKV